MIHPPDRQRTDRRTGVRYSIYAVAQKNKTLFTTDKLRRTPKPKQYKTTINIFTK